MSTEQQKDLENEKKSETETRRASVIVSEISEEELEKNKFKIEGLDIDIPETPEVKDNKWKKYGSVALNILILIALLYGFIVGLTLLSDAFRVAAGKTASQLFSFCDNPITGLVIGILSTVLFQSSSTTTSIVVSLVAAKAISVGYAVPIVMGANIGTSITNTIVAIGQIKSGNEFRRAFSGATIHDFFNLLSVLCLLPIEWIVLAANNECGFLCWITGEITHAISGLEGGSFSSPLDAIVKPLTQLIVKVNKKAYNAFSYGCGPDAKAKCILPTLVPSINGTEYGCLSDNGKICMDPDEWHKTYDGMSLISKCWLKDSWKFSDTVSGIVLIVLSLVLLCGCLVFMVKVLHKLILGKAEKYLKKALNMNGLLAMIIGTIVTAVVQSSSIVTSTLTPLVGVGVLKLEKMLPLTLGANIGTTTTSLIAALASSSTDSIQIALCHLFFNIFGILIWYPIPIMRNIPINLAKWLGRTVQKYRWFGFVYIIGVFICAPLIILGLSLLITGNTATMIVGIILILLFVLGLIGFIVYYKFFGGKELLLPILHRTAFKDVGFDRHDEELENEEKEKDKKKKNKTKVEIKTLDGSDDKKEGEEEKIEVKVDA